MYYGDDPPVPRREIEGIAADAADEVRRDLDRQVEGLRDSLRQEREERRIEVEGLHEAGGELERRVRSLEQQLAGLAHLQRSTAADAGKEA
jgi:hypothetical protein